MGYPPPGPPPYVLSDDHTIVDEQYASCRKHERETNYVKCETCQNRFKCWTRCNSKDKPYRTVISGRRLGMQGGGMLSR